MKSETTGAQFDDMTLEQLREYIKTNTGHAPHGSLNRKTLMRMANGRPAQGDLMALLSVVKDVCAAVGVRMPDSPCSPASPATAPCRKCWRSPTRWRSASPTTPATGRG